MAWTEQELAGHQTRHATLADRSPRRKRRTFLFTADRYAIKVEIYAEDAHADALARREIRELLKRAGCK